MADRHGSNTVPRRLEAGEQDEDKAHKMVWDQVNCIVAVIFVSHGRSVLNQNNEDHES